MYIQNEEQLKSNIIYLLNEPILGLDVETTHTDPMLGELRLLQLSNGSKTLVIDVRSVGKSVVSEYIRQFLENKSIVKVLHNAKFDLKWIKYHLNVDVERVFDTYLASVMIEAGIRQEKGYHGLGSVVKRYLNQDINKDQQSSDWSGQLSTDQLNYASKDVEVLIPLRAEMLKYLEKYGLIRCAKLEFEAILPVAWLELCGFYLDFDQWMSVANDNLKKAGEIEREICTELQHLLPQGNLFGESGINLNSPKQVQQYFREYGIPMPVSTKEDFLTPLANDYPIIKKLLDYKGFSKANSSFGDNYKEFIHPITNRVHANFQQIGTSTGRLACSSPNLNQIPKTNEHRACFKAEYGNILISADYSQEELRLLADYSKDKNFLDVFAKGGDFHKYTAALVFNKKIEDVSFDERYLAKRLNFGVVYGIGASKLARTANIPETEASRIIEKYFTTFKGVKRYLNFKKQEVTAKKYGRTPSGRITRYEFDENNWGSVSKAQREAANLPLQGGGADILKRTLRIFYDNSKQYHDKIKLVNLVHDQIDVEAPLEIANEVQEILVNSMKQAGSEFVTEVEIKVDAHQSLVWVKD